MFFLKKVDSLSKQKVHCSGFLKKKLEKLSSLSFQSKFPYRYKLWNVYLMVTLEVHVLLTHARIHIYTQVQGTHERIREGGEIETSASRSLFAYVRLIVPSWLNAHIHRYGLLHTRFPSLFSSMHSPLRTVTYI